MTIAKSKTDTKSSNFKDKSKDVSAYSSITTTKGDRKSKLKPANSVNVRHPPPPPENQSKMETVLKRLANGEKFDATAREPSEDKAYQGGSLGWKAHWPPHKGLEDAAHTLTVSAVDRPAYTNQVVKTIGGWVRCIELC